jgi:hypothetical protein
MPRKPKQEHQTNIKQEATEALAKLEATLTKEAEEFINSRPKVTVPKRTSSAVNPSNFIGGNTKVSLDRYGRNNKTKLSTIINPL